LTITHPSAQCVKTEKLKRTREEQEKSALGLTTGIEEGRERKKKQEGKDGDDDGVVWWWW